MLFLVLLLVLAAFGLLIASLSTSIMALSWASAVVSVLAALLLAVDALRRRTRRRGDAAAAASGGRGTPEAPATEPTEVAEPPAAGNAAAATTVLAPAVPTAEVTGTKPEAPMLSGEVPPEALAAPDPQEIREADAGLIASDEPAIQRTSRQNAELVGTLRDEVVVVDERPRYHMRTCRWLGALPILPLPVNEALELGFTPCAICRPDTELTRRHGEHPAAHG